MEYDCVAWDFFANVLKEKIETMQERSARFVKGIYDFIIRCSENTSLELESPFCTRKVRRLKFITHITVILE